MPPFSTWFENRFTEVRRAFDGRLYDMDGSGIPMHDESVSLRKSKRRYKDSLSLVLPELRSTEPLSFLDVGGGQLAWFAAPRFPGRTLALDLGATYADEARRLGVETRRWDLTAGKAPVSAESFDLVAFTEVLEHLPPPPFPYVRRVLSLLKPGGILLFSVPNMAAIAKRVKFMVAGHSPLKLGEVYQQGDGCPHHIREYTVPEVRQCLTACGLKIERLRTGDYGWYAWRRATTLLHRLTRNWGRNILVRARKPKAG